MRRFRLGLAAMAVTATGALFFTATPAQASTGAGAIDCPATYLQTPDQRACVYWQLPSESDGDDVAVYVVMSSDHKQVHGRIFGYPFFNSATLYVQQCDGLGHNCGNPVAANKCTNANSCGRDVQTSAKPTSHGHTYRTCASWEEPFLNFSDVWTMANACSPSFPV